MAEAHVAHVDLRKPRKYFTYKVILGPGLLLGVGHPDGHLFLWPGITLEAVALIFHSHGWSIAYVTDNSGRGLTVNSKIRDFRHRHIPSVSTK